MPVLTKIVAQGVKEGTFDTIDPEGVADMLLLLSAATRSIVARAIAVGSTNEMNKAIRALERRIKLYEVAIDRILGLPDRCVRLAELGYVRTVMTARHKGGAGQRSVRSRRAKP
jgi:hypothetical protein